MTTHHSSASPPSDRQLVAYLLDQLPGPDREAIAEQFFADDEVADRLLEIENDLVDQFVAGQLDPRDAQALSDRWQTTAEGSRRIRFARALRAHATSPAAAGVHAASAGAPAASATARRPWSAPRWIPAAAVVALAVTTAWLAVDNLRLRSGVSLVPTAARPMPAGAPPQATLAESGPTTASVTLDALRLRTSVAPATVEVSEETDLVRLLLAGADDAASFEATVETSPGGALVSRDAGLRRDASGHVSVWVSADQIPPGDYDVLLTITRAGQSELVGQYALRVVRPSAAR